jgi:RsiW-degrading membrane proteinase PrsW (M82 family)
MIFGIEFKTILAAALGGILPTILWLRFWWNDDKHNHGKGILILTFAAGMVSVMIALPLEQLAAGFLFSTTNLIIVAASIEEIIKFLIVALIAFSAFCIKGPTDYARFLITGALGFAALENTLFLIEPITHQGTVISILTGNLRFLGATVLHTVASASIGAIIGLAYYKSYFSKILHMFIGLLTAITLHTVFNFFIMKGTTESMVTVLAVVWVSAILLLVVFEKLKQLHKHSEYLTNLKQDHYV